MESSHLMAVGIAEIIILSLIADWLLRRMHIPGLIGMLIVGVLLGPYVLDALAPDLLSVGPDLRLIALIVILLRAGFELSRNTLHRVGGRVLLLAFIPATVEGLAITLIAPHLLGLSYAQAAILGSVLAAVSPAVVVPAMIGFIRQGRGSQKDIPAMVMAAASVDDIYVIVAHSVILGLYVGGNVNLPWQIASVPLSLVLGAAVGLGVGALLYRMFDRFNPRATKRLLIIIALALLLVRLQNMMAGDVPFAALVAAMAIGFIILEKREQMAHEMSAKLAKLWIFAEIVLFSMVGAQVDVRLAWQAGLAAAAVIGLGLAARGIGVMLCMMRSRLTIGERLFVLVAYSPKATVQAAIGAAPLAAMRAAGMDAAPGEIILAVAVLSIVITAPAGAWAIAAVGNRVLARSAEPAGESYHAAVESAAGDDTLI